MNTKLVVSILVLVGSLLIATSAQAQVAISEDGVTLPGDPEPVWGLKQYEIGDRGPAGGWVFYVTADGLRGLEVAPTTAATAVWGCSGSEIPGAEGTAIGTGESNTEDIVDPVSGCGTAGIAAAVAAEYVSPSDYFDWYLPSKDELNLMYQNLYLAGLGDFGSTYHWSSSESSTLEAWTLYFSAGQALVTNDKIATVYVRAVRTF